MKPFDILKDYGKFLKEQEELKMRTRLNVMILLLDTISETMKTFGWVKKGNGSVTETMTNSGIFKFDYVKEFKGEKVVTTINININDDYVDSWGISSGYNQIIVKGSKKIQSERWWNKNGNYGTHIEFNPNSEYDGKKVDTFHLTTHLKTIDKSYNG